MTDHDLQATDEVDDHAWRSPADLSSERLTAKAALHLAAPGFVLPVRPSPRWVLLGQLRKATKGWAAAPASAAKA